MHPTPPTSAHVRIVVAKNYSFFEQFRFGETDDTSWDLNNKTFRLDIKGNFEQVSPLLSLTSGASQIVVDDAASRVLHVYVPAADVAAALVVGNYIYDFKMVDQDGVETQLMHGEFILAESVTGG